MFYILYRSYSIKKITLYNIGKLCAIIISLFEIQWLTDCNNTIYHSVILFIRYFKYFYVVILRIKDIHYVWNVLTIFNILCYILK